MSARSRRSEGSLLRGTLITFRRRCGKPTCHCASGEPHESPALAYTEGGRTKTLIDQSRRYIEDFDEAVKSKSSPAEVIDVMMQKYSAYGNPYTLFAAAATQFGD